MDYATYVALGLDRSLADGPWPPPAINGHGPGEIARHLSVPGDVHYHPCPEASLDAPRGEVLRIDDWRDSTIYPGTKRNIAIALPAGIDLRAGAPGLLLCNDGSAYSSDDGPFGAVRVPRVLGSLLARGEIAPMVAVFVDPGRPIERSATKELAASNANRQRSTEYDSLSDRYARFVHEDVLPLVEARIGCALDRDPARRIACGLSSGGIAAFTLAWHRPDSFGRVLSHCGSFTGIRGGHNYPYLVRTTPRKPIRVFLQSGSGDIDNHYGNWPDANHAVAKALAYAGYDHRFEFGTGGHNLKHGSALFAESLRWLLRGAGDPA